MRELTEKEIKVKTVSLLLEVDKICKEQNIRYFLMMGTLLGAIRHQGFIPWDDDLDIMLPRKDFDRFVNYCEEHEKELFPYKLCTRKNVKNYTYGIPRFCDMRYKYKTTSSHEKEIDIGLFIDIYPLDNYGNSYKDMDSLRKFFDKINREYYVYINPKSSKSYLKTILRYGVKALYTIKRCIPYYRNIDDRIRREILKRTTDEDIFVGNPTWTTGRYGYKREWFLDTVLHKFEMYEFPIPIGYDYILKVAYGNYMELPPEKNRVSYHHYKIFERSDEWN